MDRLLLSTLLSELDRRTPRSPVLELEELNHDDMRTLSTPLLQTLLLQAAKELYDENAHLERAASFRFIGERSAPVFVETAADGRWVVRSQGRLLNHDGMWEYESLPTNRGPSFRERTRFSLREALSRAADHERDHEK